MFDIFKVQPFVFALDFAGSSMQLRASWLQEVAGLSLLTFISSHIGYMSYSTAKIAMRANFLKARNQWEAFSFRLGTGALLSLLTHTASRFCGRTGCTTDLDALERQWLHTEQGRRWSGKTGARCGTSFS